MKELAKKLDIASHVHFLGYRRDISDICNASDVFMFMSLQEGLPVALMEAMACGLPAVCTSIRGNTDLIENGVTGFLADNTPGATADAIQKMKSDSSLRDTLAVHALERIGRFDLTKILPVMWKIYLEN